jgi:hypothetical protein
MLVLPLLDGGALEIELAALGGAGVGRGSGTSGSSGDSASLAATPKKLATASQDVFSRDFSPFGFSSIGSDGTVGTTDAFGGLPMFGGGTGFGGLPMFDGGTGFGEGTGSVLGFWGASEGVPSKLASEFQ